MWWTTAVWVWVTAILDAFLSALGTRPAGALLTTPTVVLYTAGAPPTMESLLSDYTVATFSGYSAQSITLAGPVNIGLQAQAVIGTVTFVATVASPFIGDTILGYLLVSGGTVLVGGEVFSTPLVIANPGDFIGVNIQATIGAVQTA